MSKCNEVMAGLSCASTVASVVQITGHLARILLRLGMRFQPPLVVSAEQQQQIQQWLWDAAAGRPAVPDRFQGHSARLLRKRSIARPSPSGSDKACQACGRLLRVAAASPPMGRTRSRPSSRPPCTPSRMKLPAHGRPPRDEQVHDQQHLAQPQPQAAPGRSSCLAIPSSWRNSAMSSVSISIPRRKRLCCAWTRRAKFKP